MDPEATTEVVSGATETPADSSADLSSSDGTQTDASTTEQQAPKTEKPDFRKLLSEDPEFNAEFQRQVSETLKKRDRAALRKQAKQADATQDATEALRVVKEVANEHDEDEAAEADWTTRAARVQPQLDRLFQQDGQGNSTNPWYEKLYQKFGGAELEKRYHADPESFAHWADDEILELRISERARKDAVALARGMATEEANRQLQGMPVPLSGGQGGSGPLTLARYEAMTFEQRQEIRTKNPRAIDEMIARAQRG